MSGGNEARGRKALIEQLTGDVEALGTGESFRIAELTADGLRPWVIRRDRAGTPKFSEEPLVPWSVLHEDGILSEQEFARSASGQDGQPVVYVCTAPQEPYALQTFEWVRAAQPDRASFLCTDSLTSVIPGIIADDPLTRWYELVALRTTKAGRLLLGGRQLFPPTARRGDIVTFKIRCAESDADGTAFAVVAAESGQRGFQLISIESVKLTPGEYQIIAELREPGSVGFRVRGEQAGFSDDPRGWSTLVALVPEYLQRVAAAHLVCLVEISGEDEAVRERFENASALIKAAMANVEGGLAVTVLTYGSHSIRRLVADDPPTFQVWAVPGEKALAILDKLALRGGRDLGYPRAAQLECALAMLGRRLTDLAGRPVVVTIGRRTAFPPRVAASEVIPCPRRQDWLQAVKKLRQLPGITFGAIRDEDNDDDEVWAHLGAGNTAAGSDFDERAFAVALGLLSHSPQLLPFPLLPDEA